MTTEEITTEIGRLANEAKLLTARQNAIRKKRTELVMRLHGLTPGKTIVRGTSTGKPSAFGNEYVVVAVEQDAFFGQDKKPWVIGALTTRYGTSKSAKHVCLKTHWEIVSPEELARERV